MCFDQTCKITAIDFGWLSRLFSWLSRKYFGNSGLGDMI